MSAEIPELRVRLDLVDPVLRSSDACIKAVQALGTHLRELNGVTPFPITESELNSGKGIGRMLGLCQGLEAALVLVYNQLLDDVRSSLDAGRVTDKPALPEPPKGAVKQ